MTNAVINTDFHTFLVEFQFKSTNRCYIVQGAGLMEVLKTRDLNGIYSIKVFDPGKGTFKKISRKDLLTSYSWETETCLYLKNHYYFK